MPVSDIETGVLDSLKVLDPRRPIREADICAAAKKPLFDHLVGGGKQGWRHVETDRLGCLQVYHPYFVGACTGKFTLAPDQREA